MSAPVETVEPDAGATSLPNEGAVTQETNGASTAKEENGEVKSENTEEKIDVKEAENDDKGDVKIESPEGKKSNGSYDKQRTYDDGVLKTTARVQEGVSNSKYDPSVLPVTNDPAKIRTQVEFYFGDANLPTDKYMWELTEGALNVPVSIGNLMKFGRMKRFQPVSAVVDALRESKFLEVSGPEGMEQVKRKVAYNPDNAVNKSEARTIYVKGFGDEESSSQFDIEAFFAPYGPTKQVRLRRTYDKLFKGSVFVEFQDEETAKKFLELEPKPLWKGTLPLKIKSKKDYCEEKQEEIRDGKIEPRESWFESRGRGRGRGGFRGGNRGSRNDRDKGDRDPDDWKKRREDDRASGFKNDRRGDRRGNNRGGDRDRRGGRGGRRDDRGPRNNDRNREREENNGEAKAESKNEDATERVENEKKRPREDAGAAEEPPAKKSDTKSEVPIEA